jgi:long-chain acyl-CoA synthetase
MEKNGTVYYNADIRRLEKIRNLGAEKIVNNVLADSKKPSVLKPWLKFYEKYDVDEELPKCTMHEYLYQKNMGHLDDIALNYFDNNVTYGGFFEHIRKTARAYVAIGVKAGDIVTICSVTTPEIVYSFYAMDMIGAVPNMVDPRTSAEGIREYIKEANSRFVCMLDIAYPKIQEAAAGTDVKRIVVVSPADSLSGVKKAAYQLMKRDKNSYSDKCMKWEQFIDSGAAVKLEPVPYNGDHCGAIVHTGGTTGSPKGVMLSDDAFNALAFQFGKSAIDLERQQRFLDVMPPFIAYGFGCGIHMPLSIGMTVIIIPNLDPKKLGSLILKYKPAHMCGVPVHFQILANDRRMKHADLSYLLNCGSGGDAITVGAEDDVNRFLKSHGSRYPLAKGYGMTELCSATCNCIGDVNKRGSVGIPLINTTISAFEPGTDKELDIGDKGELCITGPTIMLGYYGKPEETANIMRRHSDGNIWIHTGDFGYVDEDGFVFIEARIKRMIIRHDGFKVFPSMIENIISTHPAVQTCSVVASRDPSQPQGDLPYVHIVLKKNIQDSQRQIKAEIIELCQEKLPEYAQPAGFKFWESLYYTPIGKVDYRRLEMESV